MVSRRIVHSNPANTEKTYMLQSTSGILGGDKVTAILRAPASP
jgi:hypothetical protein